MSAASEHGCHKRPCRLFPHDSARESVGTFFLISFLGCGENRREVDFFGMLCWDSWFASCYLGR